MANSFGGYLGNGLLANMTEYSLESTPINWCSP